MIQAINIFIRGLNDIGIGFWDYAAITLIQTSLLILLLLILDFALRKRVRAVFRYCLWMLLFIKLMLPSSFTLPTGIGYWLGDYFPSKASISKFIPQPEEAASMTIDVPQWYVSGSPGMNNTTSPAVQLESVSWQGLLFSSWVLGMIVLFVIVIRKYYFVKKLIADSRSANERSLELLDECCDRMGISRNIELRLTGNKLSPAVCGLFKPVILMPTALLTKLSREKVQAVLIHELAHVKRGDAWVNLLQTMLQIVYFYNPLLWLANSMVRRAREQAVDEMVLVTLHPETKNYSNMLIDIAEMTFWRPNFSLSIIGVVESKKALERRINHMLTRPVPKNSKLGCLGLIAIVVIGAILLPMGRNSVAKAVESNKTIVPGVRVGDYKFAISKDEVLNRLGEPNFIFYGDNKYTLDNLPENYYMSYGEISFRIGDGSVREITVLSPAYQFANGLKVGDSEQKMKKIFGNDYSIREFERKDFIKYEDKGLMFEVHKQDRAILEINVSQIDDPGSSRKASLGSRIIIPGLRVGDYTFNMKKNYILEQLGKPKRIFYGDKTYTLDNLPEKYFMHYGDVSFGMTGETIGGITALSPVYKFPNGLGVGDSERKMKQAFGDDFKIKETKWKDFLSYKDKGLMFEINKKDRTVMEINVMPVPGSEGYKKANIPPTSKINEEGRIEDKIDYPFVNDPQVIGTWKSVDFVREMEYFEADQKKWGGDLYLKELIFQPNGKTPKSWRTWTKGLVFHSGSKTASKYHIKEIDGSNYMFYEWKSGDYTIRYMKPFYYVLKKAS